MNLRCADCDQSMVLSPDGASQSIACPNCGGKRLERDQPSPTHSDGILLDTPNSALDADPGGNPNQEGIFGQTDNGWQTWKKRDESFASVASYLKEAAIDPEQYKNKVLLLRQLKAQGQNGHKLGWTPGMAGRGLQIGPFVHTWNAYNPNEVMHTNDFGDFHGDYGKKLGNQFGIDPNLIDYTTGVEISPEGKINALGKEHNIPKFLKADPRLQINVPEQEGFAFSNVSYSRTSNMDPYDSWQYKIAEIAVDPDPIVNDVVGPQHKFIVDMSHPGAMIHGGNHQALSMFDPHINGINLRDDEYGVRKSVANGDPAEVAIHNPEHENAVRALIENGANINSKNIGQYAPGVPDLMNGMIEGSVPTPPRGHPEWLNRMLNKQSSMSKVAGPLAALLGGEGLASMAAPLMRGALMGQGSNLIGGLIPGLGGGFNGGQQSAEGQLPSQARPAEMLSRVADLVTPHGNPGYYHDDPEAIDQKEFDDGSTDPNQHNPNLDSSGAEGEDNVRDHAGFGPNSAGVERLKMLAPLALHYYHSDESGANDPMLRQLHEQLEAESPGYLDHVTDEDDALLKQHLQKSKEPSAIASSVQSNLPPYAPGADMASMQQGLGPGQAAPIPLPGQAGMLDHPGGKCPYCGGIQAADGSCPQCGSRINPMGGSIPGQLQQGMQPMASVISANHQGPVTPEQQAAVAELLNQTARHQEIPTMLLHPEQYSKEMAQVANQVNTPTNVDPNEPPVIPPAPPQEIAPPGATMPVPNMTSPAASGPGGQMISHIAADNVAKRCPKCNSASTGMLNVDGESHCHSCGNIWRDKNVTQDSEGSPLKTADAIQDSSQQATDPSLDNTQTWTDDQGQPLVEGQQYEIHNPNYTIPDIVTLVHIKPTAIVVDAQGYQHEIHKQEVENEGLTFTQSATNTDEPQQAGIPEPNTQAQPTIDTADRQQLSSSVDDEGICKVCSSTHISSSMSSATTSFHECYKCGNTWETKEEDYATDGSHLASWILEDSGSNDDFFGEMERHKAMRSAGQSSRDLSSIASRDPRLQAIKETLNENARTSGKKFTPYEQKQFIDEQGTARNADLLDLEDTHYVTKYDSTGKANGENVRDEDLFMGL